MCPLNYKRKLFKYVLISFLFRQIVVMKFRCQTIFRVEFNLQLKNRFKNLMAVLLLPVFCSRSDWALLYTRNAPVFEVPSSNLDIFFSAECRNCNSKKRSQSLFLSHFSSQLIGCWSVSLNSQIICVFIKPRHFDLTNLKSNVGNYRINI